MQILALRADGKDFALLVSPPVVLIVEDEVLIRMNLADELSEHGFRVIEAGNAAEALKLLYEYPCIDLMFTDIDMPGDMNGLILAEHVRDRWPTVRIIVTSGKHQVQAKDMPNNSRFVGKPYAMAAVVDTMREMAA